MNLLRHAIEARDTLRECLGIHAATIVTDDRKALIVKAPTRPALAGALSIDIYLRISQPLEGATIPTCTAMFAPGSHNRTFPCSRDNIIGWCGLPIHDDPIPDADEKHLGKWLHYRLKDTVDFLWQRMSDDVHLSTPLTPLNRKARVNHRGTSYTAADYPRYKVYRTTNGPVTWTFDLVHAGGSQLSPSGEEFPSSLEALYAAERHAAKFGHIPVLHDEPLHVLLWRSRYGTSDDDSNVHTAILSDGRYVEIHEAPATHDEPALFAVTLREHDGAEHQGSEYFDDIPFTHNGKNITASERALDHALRLLKDTIGD
jgi:hypothetical protein